MLSEESLPELNDVFTSKLEAGWVGERLIVRYATGDILAQVKVNYERRRDEAAQQNQHLCLPAVIYYFLKHDPQYGEQELRRALAAPGPPPICYNIAHRELGAYAMSPALERIAIEYLDSPLVVIKDGAAELLGKHGSAAALNPLWETMAYFREYWRGKETELLDNREGVQFERTLRAALAQADAWFLGEQELNRLLSLCSTDWCKQDVGFWIQQAKSPIQLQFSPVFDGVAYSLAQYELRSEEELRKKLAQFPRGTAIRVERLANEEARPEIRAARERAEQAALAAGHQISP
jgi:hypothetical protein